MDKTFLLGTNTGLNNFIDINNLNLDKYEKIEFLKTQFGEYIVNIDELKNKIKDSKVLICIDKEIDSLQSFITLFQKLTLAGFKFDSYVSPSATIHDSVRVKSNSIIYPGATINQGARLGIGNIIGENSYLGNKCTLKNFIYLQSFINVGSLSKIGSKTSIYEGSIISSGVKIGKSVFIGYKMHLEDDIEDYLMHYHEGQTAVRIKSD